MTIANQLAPIGREGFYQRIVNSTATIGSMIGPFTGGVLVDLYGMKMMILLLRGLVCLTIFTRFFYDETMQAAKYEAIEN